MKASEFLSQLTQADIEFFTGVPDSLLGAFCDQLMRIYGINGKHHIVAQNEGGCVALASGYYLATFKTPCVYMQNSGIGNALNPVVSLTHPDVFGIPVLFVIGWRGEPRIPDEPQHIFQGEITERLLSDLDIEYFILDKSATQEQLLKVLLHFKTLFSKGKSAAFLIRKGALSGDAETYSNGYTLNREEAIGIVLDACEGDPVVSTTGKISRELFELRKKRADPHNRDFLAVGSMGHSVLVALGIALQQPERRIWCFDGDGSVLMHMGSFGVVGNQCPENFVHVLFNNAAHETVGGIPTVADNIDFTSVARSCGYAHVYKVYDTDALNAALEQVKTLTGPVFIEIHVTLDSRADLGRPTISTQNNKHDFMEFLKKD